MRPLPPRHLEAIENAKRALAFSTAQQTSERMFASYVSCPVCPPDTGRECTLVGLGVYRCKACECIFSQNGLYS